MTEATAALPVTAHVVLRDREGRVLLLRTARDHGRWQLPGGRALPGESPADAAVRETMEEIALRIRVGRLLVVAFIAPSRPGLAGRISFVFGDITLPDRQTSRIRVDGAEVDGWDLVPYPRALTMLHPLLAERLRAAAQRRGGAYLEQQPERAPAAGVAPAPRSTLPR